ncbi:hypothetical protein ACLBKU_05365 [Erythrobacter sp. NE805]|uniref:hypothetical protein n=1 Tax=Erythrobacter sp. NE805 TaxID=3389875 RepID=UPI00396B3005
MRPQSIIRFDQLYFATLALGFVGLAINYETSIQQLEADATAARLGGSTFVIGAYAISTAIALLLWYFVSRRASNAARWIVTVMTGFGLVTLPFSFMMASVPPASLAVAVISAAVQAAMLWFLFRPDANAWFKQGTQGMDPDVFE